MPRLSYQANRIGAWFALTLAIVSIKVCLLAIDPVSLFLMGDSGAYLGSAVSSWRPGDRSFTYGLFFLGPIIETFSSLKAVVIVQSLLSAATALLAAVCLRIGFRAPFWIAAVAALLYAVEPLALLYERMIMTEALAMFLLALFVLTGLSYINRPRVWLLVLLAALGTCVLSLRTFYIPVILISTIAALLLAAPRLKDEVGRNARALGAKALLHVMTAVIATVGFHAAYQQYFSYVTGKSPSYNDGSGLFLMAAWAPLVTTADFPNKGLAERVLMDLEVHDRHARVYQRFGEGGLVERLVDDRGTRRGNDIAQETALRAAQRDPVAVIGLAVKSYGDYWDGPLMKKIVRNEQGWTELYPDAIDHFKACCDEDLSKRHLQDTFAKRWHREASVWYRVLLLTPLFAILLCIPRDTRMQAAFLGVIVWAIMLVSVSLIVETSVRFHHALAWLACIQIGMALSYFRWTGSDYRHASPREDASHTRG